MASCDRSIKPEVRDADYDDHGRFVLSRRRVERFVDVDELHSSYDSAEMSGNDGDGGGKRSADAARRVKREVVADDNNVDSSASLSSLSSSAMSLSPSTDSSSDSELDVMLQPNWELSGALARDAPDVLKDSEGDVAKYHPPTDAAVPAVVGVGVGDDADDNVRWQLFAMRAQQHVATHAVFERSCYRFGRDAAVNDIVLDDASCSKQHAVLQFRRVHVQRERALVRRCVPYVVDLASTNGTFLNRRRIDAQRFIELKQSDTLRFGDSDVTYVLLHDNMVASAAPS